MRRIIIVFLALTVLVSISSSVKVEARGLQPMRLCYHNHILYDTVEWWQMCPGTDGNPSILEQHHATGITRRGTFHPELLASSGTNGITYQQTGTNSGTTLKNEVVIMHVIEDDHEDCEITYTQGF